jgi:NADH:ubiquinone oxidoreductase subunit 6 (subunit J)
MSTTIVIEPPSPSAVRNLPTFGEMLKTILPLIGVVIVAGPPAVLLAGPLVLGALMLIGPFALVATAVLVVGVALVAAALLVALAGAIVTAPCLLVRSLRAHRRRHAHSGAPAGQLATVESRYGAA